MASLHVNDRTYTSYSTKVTSPSLRVNSNYVDLTTTSGMRGKLISNNYYIKEPLSSIRVTSYVSSYYINQPFSKGDFVLKGTYRNNSEITINSFDTAVTVSYNFSTVGSKTVTIYYTDGRTTLSTSYTVTIQNTKIEFTNNNILKIFYSGINTSYSSSNWVIGIDNTETAISTMTNDVSVTASGMTFTPHITFNGENTGILTMTIQNPTGTSHNLYLHCDVQDLYDDATNISSSGASFGENNIVNFSIKQSPGTSVYVGHYGGRWTNRDVAVTGDVEEIDTGAVLKTVKGTGTSTWTITVINRI
jgi:hypothetical protein